jgi:hypothetical protein
MMNQCNFATLNQDPTAVERFVLSFEINASGRNSRYRFESSFKRTLLLSVVQILFAYLFL